MDREKYALTLLLRKGRVHIVHQGGYRYARVRASGVYGSNADCLVQVFGGTCSNNRWVAGDKGSIEAVADAFIGTGKRALTYLGNLLKQYATAPYGDTAIYADIIEAVFELRTIRLEPFRRRD